MINKDESPIEMNHNNDLELEPNEAVEANDGPTESVDIEPTNPTEIIKSIEEATETVKSIEETTETVNVVEETTEELNINLNKKTKDVTTIESNDLDTRIEFINNDTILENLNIGNINIDYTNNLYNGNYCKILACEEIKKYNTVEKLIYNGKLCVKHTDPLTTNLFLGIAQNDATPGEIVNVLISGISIINVRNKINLPLLKHNNQGQLSVIRDKNNQYIIQSLRIPINKNDLLVLAGTTNDILVGPLTRYYHFNTSNCKGLLSPYKSILITNNLIYNMNYNDQNTILNQKISYGNKLIQVLDINIKTNEIIGYLH